MSDDDVCRDCGDDGHASCNRPPEALLASALIAIRDDRSRNQRSPLERCDYYEGIAERALRALDAAPPGQLVRTAREVAHDAVKPWWNEPYPDGLVEPPTGLVDAVTAAIEARDESWNRNINANDRDWERRQARSLAAIPEVKS